MSEVCAAVVGRGRVLGRESSRGSRSSISSGVGGIVRGEKRG